MRRLARERMDVLFQEAGERARKGQAHLADRYCLMARRLSMRYNVPLGPRHRRSYCRRCGAYLLPGRSCTVRLRRGSLNIRCARCSCTMRFPLEEKKKKGVDGDRGSLGQAESMGHRDTSESK
jgi:ribonuclease P protein subunit RPR2